LKHILDRLAAITGKKAPTVQLPYAVAYAAGVVTTAWARVSGRTPMAPLEAVKMAKKKMFVTHDKAARELGYAPGPVDEALRRAVEWFGSR
jgi:dihydroflavonol-4-reductase